ncbi:MAG TPA: PBP1A family penicillin-binding protein [Rhizomicrobium sp.]|jgi:penicillin-binding protein 1A|nr:PBP1A family penicillin-binding protein [Rhizomicrobium sp.]
MAGDERYQYSGHDAGLAGWLKRNQGGFLRFLIYPVLLVAIAVAGVFLAPIVLGWFAPPLDVSKDLYAVNRPVAFTFLDAAGREVGHRGAVVGDRLHLNQMPDYLPAAFIAVEDRRFYSHNGIDPRGLVRALWTDFQARQWVAGGSTITQQTAKIIYTEQERTFSRKLTELTDALSLEKSLTKQQILELYLNRLYLGSGSYGVDGAAHTYFGVSARHVSLAQAAMLATLTRAPSVFSPRRDLAAAQARANTVLNAMVETGAITPAQAADAKAHPAIVADSTVTDARNYFLDTAADEATKRISVNGRPPGADLIVHTTLDPKLDEAARHALSHILATRGVKVHASEGAVVIEKPDGAVVALIGGKDYTGSVFNRATQARRQPGSAFKPFVYLAALESGATPWDTRDDEPVNINGWTPTNFGGRNYGTQTLAGALAHSVNTITAGLAQEVGLSAVIEAAKRCGITSPLEANASLALGTSEVTPMELTNAYATFANGGMRVNPYLVTEVDDSGGHPLYKRTPANPPRVIASHVDRDLVAMMYGVMIEGTGRGAAIVGHQAAGKTGTTQDYHDAWFVGYTTDYVTGVWVGNDDSSPMKNVTGGTLPAAVWKSVMTTAEKGITAKPLDMSPQQAPTEVGDETTIFASGNSGDDESGYGSQQQQQDYSDDQQQPSDGQQQRPRRSFWNWLFSSGNSGGQQEQQEPQGPPPPAPPQGAQYQPYSNWRSAPGQQPPSNAPPQSPPMRQYPPPNYPQAAVRQYPPPANYPQQGYPPANYPPRNVSPYPPPQTPPPPRSGDDEGPQNDGFSDDQPPG